MASCYHPIKAWKTPTGDVTFNVHRSYGPSFQLPCCRCIGCKLAKSKEWAIRCTHEAQMHPVNGNSYATLTYNTDHLPKNNNLNHKDFQVFIRSLRKTTHKKIRYFMCGEYGKATEKNGFIARPHFHVILFGIDFREDKEKHYINKRGDVIYRSETLEAAWTNGFSEFGTVTFESAAYVARYSLKKLNEAEREIIDHETGEVTDRKKEYTKMSLKDPGGIGASWYLKYAKDVFPHDYVVNHKGQIMTTPKYYRELLRRENPELAEKLKKIRLEKAKRNTDNSPKRLKVREFIQNEKLKKLPRDKN